MGNFLKYSDLTAMFESVAIKVGVILKSFPRLIPQPAMVITVQP